MSKSYTETRFVAKNIQTLVSGPCTAKGVRLSIGAVDDPQFVISVSLDHVAPTLYEVL